MAVIQHQNISATKLSGKAPNDPWLTSYESDGHIECLWDWSMGRQVGPSELNVDSCMVRSSRGFKKANLKCNMKYVLCTVYSVQWTKSNANLIWCTINQWFWFDWHPFYVKVRFKKMPGHVCHIATNQILSVYLNSNSIKFNLWVYCGVFSKKGSTQLKQLRYQCWSKIQK